VAVVVGGVVDQHVDRPDLGDDGLEHRLEGVEVAQVAGVRRRAPATGRTRLSSALDSSSEKSRKTTRAPWRAKPSVRAAPMPEPPPVMTTTSRLERGVDRRCSSGGSKQAAGGQVLHQGGDAHGPRRRALALVVTLLTQHAQAFGGDHDQVAGLWVKPAPGASRSSIGANMVPR
jgi:hypothetical protein